MIELEAIFPGTVAIANCRMTSQPSHLLAQTKLGGNPRMNDRHEIQDAVRVILSRADDLLGQMAQQRQNHANERGRWEQYTQQVRVNGLIIGIVVGSFLTAAILGAAWMWL